LTRTYAIIPAAGQGARFSTNGGNKLFALLQGKPVLRWTVEAIASHSKIDGIVVVAGKQTLAECRQALVGIDKVSAIIVGGASRQESVAIGLFTLGGSPDDVVLIHDGARPLVTSDIIDRCLSGVHESGNAVAALPVTDTLKSVDSAQMVLSTVEREGLWAIQTPQAFRVETLYQAHVAARDAGFEGTDDASLIENFGEEPVHLVNGSIENLKITRSEDLKLAHAIVTNRLETGLPETRFGYGYDIHRFAAGRRLVLGGVEIDSPQGLDGHSDADVLLHALCDALLGAAALPDIGVLFPNTDSAYAGIASTKLLAIVVEKIHSLNFRVVNVDATVIAEMPKISPYVAEIRQTIATILDIDTTRVGIKATTNEGLGALGQGLGIAAHAVAALSGYSTVSAEDKIKI
jgi:2-C-methyl-D-erythritol 4-phosphate cytidylyltransferase / 2-C-methyl-D-erythritol 2,4-cyclodiphosphate synthase